MAKSSRRSHPSSQASLSSPTGFTSGFSSSTPLLIPSPAIHLKPQPEQFAVIDNRTVITGSFNWSPSAAHRNDETLLVIESPPLAAHFSREMDRMWRGAELGITPRLQNKLQQARKRCGSGALPG